MLIVRDSELTYLPCFFTISPHFFCYLCFYPLYPLTRASSPLLNNTCEIALYALIAKQFRVYDYILDEDKQDGQDVGGGKGENKKLFERYVLLLLCQ